MCGVVGIVSKTDVNQQIYDALLALQHRGQDSAGMVTWENLQRGAVGASSRQADGRLQLRKGNGLVREIFEERHMRRLRGSMGIGHVRYPTAGTSSAAEAQPMYVNAPYGISLAHNGNLTNSGTMEADVFRADLRHVNTDSDSEILLNVFAHELQQVGALKPRAQDVFRAVEGVHQRCRGAYAAVAMINGFGIVAFRDPHGIRPLAFGVKETASGRETMVASESCAVDILGFDLVRDVAPGEAIFNRSRRQLHDQALRATRRACAVHLRACLPRPGRFGNGRYFRLPGETAHGREVGRAHSRSLRRPRPRHRRGDSDSGVEPHLRHTPGLCAGCEVPRRLRQEPLHRTHFHHARADHAHEIRATEAEPHRNRIPGKNVLLVEDSIVRARPPAKLSARPAGPGRARCSWRWRRRPCAIQTSTASTCRPPTNS